VGTLSGLTGSATVVCFAVANNGVGDDVCSPPSDAVTVTARLPSAPAVTSVASPAAGALAVSFSGSADAGTPPVARYVVKCVRLRSGGVTLPSCEDVSSGSFTQTVALGGPLQASFASLPGDAYACFAIAQTSNGASVCSPASSVTGVAGSPTAPTVGAPTSPGAGQLAVPFAKSLERGYPAIANYTVKCLASSVAPSCGSTGAGVYSTVVDAAAVPLQASFGGLPGGLYACFAIAANGVGPDQCSGLSRTALVPELPGAPSGGTPTSPSTGRIVLPFSAPANAGFPPVATYAVRCVPT
jgi:hypothetical protein